MTLQAVQRGRRGAALVVVVAAAMSLVASCSDDGSGASSSSGSVATTDATSPGTGPVESTAASGVDTSLAPLPPPIVEQIAAAVAALETEMGGPQQYFEINATSQLVNLFVALNDGAVAQPWLFVGGELTSAEGQQASGGTFAGGDVAFDPATIFDPLLAEVPGIQVESFYVHGDGDGNLLYGVLATSERGGGLDIVLAADGRVLSVDPVSEAP